MAVFRIEKTKDYTVMSNHHLKNTQLLCDNTPKGCNFYFELPIYEVNLNE